MMSKAEWLRCWLLDTYTWAKFQFYLRATQPKSQMWSQQQQKCIMYQVERIILQGMLNLQWDKSGMIDP